MINKALGMILISICLSLLGPRFALSGQIIINSDDQFQFARQYMGKGEYHRAVGEFERFIYFFPKDEKVPMARYLIGLCYLMGKDYSSSRKVLEDVYKIYTKEPLAGKALFLIGESYYRQGMLEEAKSYFKEVIKGYPQSNLKDISLYRLGWTQLKEDRWKAASDTFMLVGKNSPFYASSQDLSTESLKGIELPRKDPRTAGIMSTVIPGLGHVYSDRPRNGMIAFLLNGIFIWAAVESFDQDHDVLGGVLTVLEAGWYSGSIYSAVNSAHKYNRKVGNDFRRGLGDKLDLHLFTSGDGQLGLALKMVF